ncbi:MAG: hypothetical protein ACI8QS_000196 [Planctomycetota bacterium]|jgi:hypothetical protein
MLRPTTGATGEQGKFTEAMPQFLSHATPAEVLLLGDEAHLVRRRREAREHLEGQLPLPLACVPEQPLTKQELPRALTR